MSTTYASHVPNIDPQPWERPTTGERFEEFYDADLIPNPREEFKSYPVQEVNHVLEDFRRLINEIAGGWEPESIQREASWWVYLIGTDPKMQNRNHWGDLANKADADEIRHALRVLTRLTGGTAWTA